MVSNKSWCAVILGDCKRIADLELKANTHRLVSESLDLHEDTPATEVDNAVCELIDLAQEMAEALRNLSGFCERTHAGVAAGKPSRNQAIKALAKYEEYRKQQ